MYNKLPSNGRTDRCASVECVDGAPDRCPNGCPLLERLAASSKLPVSKLPVASRCLVAS